MAPTNRLTNGTFDDGGTGWTEDDPESDGTRTYTWDDGALMTVGDGTGAISQQIAVTAGEELFIALRGCGNSTDIPVKVGIYNGSTFRYASTGVHAAPLDTDWPIRSEWRGWRVVVPSGWTTATVFVTLGPGTVWLQEIGCYDSPDLCIDGDFSTNTDGTTSGDGAVPEGWVYDWRAVFSGPSITHDASTAGGTITSGSSRTFSHTIGGGSNRVLAVMVLVEEGSGGPKTVSGVTYDGVAMTLAGAIATTEAANVDAELWYMLEADLPAAGAHDVVVTLSSALSSGCAIFAATSIADAAQAAPIVATNRTNTDGTTFSTPVVTVAANSWALDVVAGNNANTWTADGGQTERTDQQAGGTAATMGTSTKVVAAAGSTTLGWTAAGSQGRFAQVVAVWQPASGWETYGGALRHTGPTDTYAASGAFAVTAGERLWVTARAWGGELASLYVFFGTSSTFAYAANVGVAQVGTSEGTAAAADTWQQAVIDGFVEVPAGVGATHARVALYPPDGGTQYWDKVSVRRLSTVGKPDVKVEVNLGGLSGLLEKPGYPGNWIVGDTGGYNVVGSTFMSVWPGGAFDGIAWTDITEYARNVSIRRGRRSRTDTYETGSCTIELDNSDRRFDPLWTHDDAPYARAGVSYIRSGRPIRVSLIDPDTTEPWPIFTGRANRWEPGWSYPSEAWVRVDASDATRDLNNPILETTFASQSTDDLLHALLDAVGWPESLRDIDAGEFTAPEITMSGSVLGFMRGCAVREFGRFYVDGAGRARMRIGTSWRSIESQGVIDPNSTVGSWGLDPEELRVVYDDTLLRNRVKAIRYGGTEADSQVASDDDSRDQYGTSSYEVTDLLVSSNADALEWAQTELLAGSSPVARVDSATIRPDVNPAWWPYLLWADFGDQFTARAYPPPFGTELLEQAVQLEAVDLDVRPINEGGWRVVWQFVPLR